MDDVRRVYLYSASLVVLHTLYASLINCYYFFIFGPVSNLHVCIPKTVAQLYQLYLVNYN